MGKKIKKNESEIIKNLENKMENMPGSINKKQKESEHKHTEIKAQLLKLIIL